MRTLFACWSAATCRPGGQTGKLNNSLLRLALAGALALMLPPTVAPQGQQSHQTPVDGESEERRPAKIQQEEILKADHQRDLKDATQLIELAEELKQELEKNDRHVLSLSSVKKTEEIEKLAKHIHSRLVR